MSSYSTENGSEGQAKAVRSRFPLNTPTHPTAAPLDLDDLIPIIPPKYLLNAEPCSNSPNSIRKFLRSFAPRKRPLFPGRIEGEEENNQAALGQVAEKVPCQVGIMKMRSQQATNEGDPKLSPDEQQPPVEWACAPGEKLEPRRPQIAQEMHNMEPGSDWLNRRRLDIQSFENDHDEKGERGVRKWVSFRKEMEMGNRKMIVFRDELLLREKVKESR